MKSDTPPWSKMTAEVYDAIYASKDYKGEAEQVKDTIGRLQRSSGSDLLDVACGTGGHIAYLKDDFKVAGLDMSAEQLAWAKDKFPEVAFHRADMVDFKLAKRFDAIVCLFRSIGYANELADMRRTVGAMAWHLKPGGVLLIDPWIMEHEWDGQRQVWAAFADLPELKISRMNATVKLEGDQSTLALHHLVGRPAGVEYFVERHRLGVYAKEDYLRAFADAGLEAGFESEDKENGRPLRLFTGVRSNG